MSKTAEEIKNKIANQNNFDSFERAIRYTFGRQLLQSEKEFIDKLVNESMEEYAKLKTSELALTQVPVGDDTPLSRCLKRISELEKENQELKRELARYEIHDLKRK